MRRILLFFVSLFTASLGCVAEPSGFLSFERDASIWVANLDGSGAKKIARGSNPNLSPGGARIAFNTDSNDSQSLDRRIAVVEVATKKVTTFKNEIPSDNCQRPIWSPDGTHLLFNIWTDSDWHLALVNADGSGFRYVKKAAPKNNSFWSQCWATDGRSIYAQDLDKLYQFALDGMELKKWSLRSLFPKGSFSSASNFSVSPDGTTLLMDVDMDDEEAILPDWDGPPPSLWTLEIASGRATRLTDDAGEERPKSHFEESIRPDCCACGW